MSEDGRSMDIECPESGAQGTWFFDREGKEAARLQHEDGTPIELPALKAPKTEPLKHYDLVSAYPELPEHTKERLLQKLEINNAYGTRVAQSSTCKDVAEEVDIDHTARILARLLDEPWTRFVAERAEFGEDGSGLDRLEWTEDVAWARDELGARTRWTDVASRFRNLLDATTKASRSGK